MKLLFVHDTKIKEDSSGTYYTGGSFNEEVWNRYLSICTNFTLIARKDPIIYNVNYANSKFNTFNMQKINFVEVPDVNSSIKSFFNLQKRKELHEIIKKHVLNSDYLIARVPSINGAIAVKYAKEFNKPFLVEVVGCSWDALRYYNFKGKFFAPFSFMIQRNVIKQANYAIYVTEKFLQNRYPTQGKSVNCSNVYIREFNEQIINKRINNIKSKNIKNEKLIVGTIGALDVKYKGQTSMIRALGELKKQGIENFEYQLVGSGDQQYLKEVAKKYKVTNQINFLGTMQHDKIFNWLDKIDIYVQPSLTEGLPRSLVEAMSRGILAIGTNVGGIPELLNQKYLISKSRNNHLEIADILKKLTKEDFENQAVRNFIVSKRYSKEIIDNRRKKFFETFIKESEKLKTGY
jgi:glycosyltransferase involved in cell wall biosynthesis